MKATNTYKSVRDKLMDIQKNGKEPDLFPTLKQLFLSMQFTKVEITHGANEYGKDLVFSKYDESLRSEDWYAVVVKNKNADLWDFQTGGEIARQVTLAFEKPYLDSAGNNNYINKVFVVVNGTISHQARETLRDTLQPYQRNNIQVWNYQNIESEIESHIKDLFLSGATGTQEEFAVNMYKTKMAERLSNLDNAKELYAGFEISEINDIFVNVRTANKKYESQKNIYSDEKSKISPEELDDSVIIINSNRDTIIRGIPTSGKTILLKRVGVNALQKYSSIGVFWFRFRDIDIEHFDLWSEVSKQFVELSGGVEFKHDYFDRILLLFDALDEIDTDEARTKIIENIHASLEGYEKCHIIISGRMIDLFDNNPLFLSYEMYDLLPFDISQALNLVKKIIPDNKEKNNKFISAIKNQQLSNNITRTPMALTLMAIMYKDDSIDLQELPANITELYSKFSDYYLDKWDATKGLSSQYKYEEVRNIMGFIANYMQTHNICELSCVQLEDVLTEIKRTHSFDELEDVDAYISRIKSRNTLLCYDSSRDTFYFIGVSFQEYFTSYFYDDSSEQFLLDRIYQDWWQNVIVFYNGRNPRRTVFLEKMISKVIPIDSRSMFYHMDIVSKTMQAAHLIPNATEKEGILNIIQTFDRFYKSLLASIDTNAISYRWTTLDMILQCRNLFEQLFASKHIKIENFSQVANQIFDTVECNHYSDVTLYCICYHLAYHNNDTSYFEKMSSIAGLNTRWDRILSKDIDHMRLRKQFPVKVYQRIERKQKRNKVYIDQQFKEPAILHLTDGKSLLSND